MHINKEGYFDLTYCTNIHMGESWSEVFADLKKYVLPLKARLAPNQPFGIGLRLSRFASDTLVANPKELQRFKQWLEEHQLYVMTINGFPYGEFHNQCVKDRAYSPDWNTQERLDYSLNLVHILDGLTPDGQESGFSTSPLSYKPWLDAEATYATFHRSSLGIARIVEAMIPIYKKTGKLLHIDVEPEPDCLIETTDELVHCYHQWLIPIGGDYLVKKLNISKSEAEEAIRRHVQVCYDICHASVEYEKPAKIFKTLSNAGIQIGKIQVSAALKCNLKKDDHFPNDLYQFVDKRYLHQTIERDKVGCLSHFNDLPDALEHGDLTEIKEARTHFHVPVFIDHFQHLDSTQSDIVSALKILQKNKATRHLEIETYTWDVLPSNLRLDIIPSIQREYEWVLKQFEPEHK